MYFQETRKLLRTLVDVPVQVVRANVDDVDTDTFTAEVTALDGSGVRYDVQLRVKGDGESLGVITVPKKDSMVLIGIIDNNPDSCYIVQYSEVVKVHIEMGDKLLIEIPEDGKVKIKAKEVLFDGAKSGLIDLQGILGRLNDLENAFSSHTHEFAGPSGTTDPPPTYTPTTENQIKTDKITWP